jgi:hypothetical protein
MNTDQIKAEDRRHISEETGTEERRQKTGDTKPE